jgi:hypothetical protein
MAYTTLDLVCSLFPTFKRGTPQQNPADTVIQTYLDNRASKINAVLLRRFGEAISAAGSLTAWLEALPQAEDASNVLEEINRFGAAVTLVDVFAAYGVSGVRDQAVKVLVPTYEQLWKELNALDANGRPMESGPYDKLFDPLARTETPRPTLEGIGGAETDGSTPEDRGENRAFGIDDVF